MQSIRVTKLLMSASVRRASINTALPREASLPWLAEAGIETEARAQLQRKHVPATWSAKQLGVVF